MKTTEWRGVRFCDTDIVNRDDWIARDDSYNSHRMRPWLLHDHGFTLAVVFASNLQDALDIAADKGKLDRFAVSREDEAEYGPEGEGLDFLGNAGKVFDTEGLEWIELPNPNWSFVAQFDAMLHAQKCDKVGLSHDTPKGIVRDAMIDSGLIRE